MICYIKITRIRVEIQIQMQIYSKYYSLYNNNYQITAFIRDIYIYIHWLHDFCPQRPLPSLSNRKIKNFNLPLILLLIFFLALFSILFSKNITLVYFKGKV